MRLLHKAGGICTMAATPLFNRFRCGKTLKNAPHMGGHYE